MTLFDESYYLSHYPEVAASGLSALEHYTTIGWQLNYNPNFVFNTFYYLYTNPDVAAAEVNPLNTIKPTGFMNCETPVAFSTHLFI